MPRIELMGAVDYISVPTHIFSCCVIGAGTGPPQGYTTYIFGTLCTLFNLTFLPSLLILEPGSFLPQGLLLAFPSSWFSLFLDLTWFPPAPHTVVLFKGHHLRRGFLSHHIQMLLLPLACPSNFHTLPYCLSKHSVFVVTILKYFHPSL